MDKMICPYCGQEFQPNRSNQKYCNKKCAFKANAAATVERKRELIKTRRALGLCISCGRRLDVVGKDLCPECLERRSERKLGAHRCQINECEIRANRKDICCRFCKHRKTCEDVCLNDPRKCGLLKE